MADPTLTPGDFTRALLHELRTAPDTAALAERMRPWADELGARLILRRSPDWPIGLVPLPPPPDPLNEHVPSYDDNAAFVDELGRDAFAEVVAARIQEARDAVKKDEKRNGAVMVHLHGRWGIGKSSVLNFLRAKMSDEGKVPGDSSRATRENWIVVDFNAWQHQRMPAPWWPLIRAIYKRCAADGSSAIRRRWLWRHFTLRWAQPVALFLFVLAIGIALLTAGGTISDPTEKHFDESMKMLSAFLGIVGAMLALLKAPAILSNKAAQDLEELRVNKQDVIKRFFEGIINSVQRPIVVFIDDLDRCASSYVVELLEGVQTLFRGAPVVYVVAADRDWIRKSFEEGYKDFSGAIGQPGRPLGHLFLEKMFQISAGIPRIGDGERERYWRRLLAANEPRARQMHVIRREAARNEAMKQVQGAVSMEEINALVKAAAEDKQPELAQALSEAGAVHIASSKAEEQLQHRLTAFAELIEPNPRAMKRLVNAFGMNQASLILLQRPVDADALARWTILEMRWPLFAEALAQHPELVERVHSNTDLGVEGIAKETNALSTHPLVQKVVGAPGANGRLTSEAIRSIVGESVAAEKLAVKETERAASPASMA